MSRKEARRFKRPKENQLDDDDPKNDDDYEEERNSFAEDDDDSDDDDDAPAVVCRAQTSKGSKSRRIIKCEDEEVGYEDHSKISKKLSHFSGSSRLSTLKPLIQKKSQISSHGSHQSADRHERSSQKKCNTNENFEKSVNKRIEKLEESIQSLIRLITAKGQAVTPIGYKQASVSSILLLTDTQNATLAIWLEAQCLEESNFSITG
jgi:hypothetical protein